MIALYLPAIIVAFLITLLEFTEVVALVFALSADTGSIGQGALGATSGAAVISAAALGFGAAIIAFPHEYLLWASAAVLTGFGVFLFRSTVRTYRRWAYQRAGVPSPPRASRALQFAGGFAVGVVETTEAVVVLLALAAAGYGFSALVGAIAGGFVLVSAAAIVHERIRGIKVRWLKLGATSLLFSFAVFWAGEAVGYSWPGSDLVLIPLVLFFAVVVRGSIALILRRPLSRPTA